MSGVAGVRGPETRAGAGPVGAPGSPRLLSAAGEHGLPLARHRLVYPAPPPPGGRARDGLVTTVQRAGLRGRGGASFPTGTKLEAVRAGGRRPVVVVNGSEGEPASGKDKLLLASAPHLVLDGALLAAAAVGADLVTVCVDRTATAALGAVERALGERRQAADRPGVDAETGVPVRLVAVPPRYVAGEETALVHWLNGGPAAPTSTPPRPFQRGVDGRPTLVDNVETLAHLAQVARWGPDWFRQLGTREEPGTALVTLSGAVDRPGVYEVPVGTPLAGLVRAAGVPGGVGAVLVGGYFGGWLDPGRAGRASLDNQCLRSLGASLGCGAVVVLPAGACGLSESARVLAWLAGETAGQCGPCVHGLAAVAAAVADVRDGRGGDGGLDRLRRWAGQIEGRGACRLPDGAVRLLRSTLDVFADDVRRHLHHGGCAGAARPPLLPVPARDPGPGRSPWR
ncbi:MAG TPA: NADH-ubiquinone oxidoreductase-F iron-sulfur binding region domain-containing protein [Actinomycetota bacterium]|nr:NADH-ubiquinone oxidoreductase-F iron-sulfur binding region domain-containing protein [Actinomycetota bacterium]